MTPTKTAYKHVVFTIDIDFVELVDAIGLDYTRRGDDLKVSVGLPADEIDQYFDEDPERFCANVLNDELAETCTKVTVRNAKEGQY
jgi:hypothetical protein